MGGLTILGRCVLPPNASCRFFPDTPERMLFKTVLSCVTLFTVLLNLLVVISILHFSRQLHTPTNFLILSLAVSDLLVGAVMMPISFVNLFTCLFIGQLSCAMSVLTSYTLTSASVGSMVLVSVDRYVAICDPLHYSSIITTGRIIIGLFLCWSCSVLYNVILMKDMFILSSISNYCSKNCSLVLHFIPGIIDLVLTFFAPVIVIVVLYMRVFLVAVSQARLIQAPAAAVKSEAVVVKRSELRAARTLGIVLLVFLICISPFFSSSLAQDGAVSLHSSGQVWLFYINSSINPLIYAFFYPWFRKAVKVIVTLQILQPGSRDTNMMQR